MEFYFRGESCSEIAPKSPAGRMGFYGDFERAGLNFGLVGWNFGGWNAPQGPIGRGGAFIFIARVGGWIF